MSIKHKQLCYSVNSTGLTSTGLNLCCHMDYFNDVLATFLALERISCVVVYAGPESSRISSKNILLCVPKMNEGLTGLERRECE